MFLYILVDLKYFYINIVHEINKLLYCQGPYKTFVCRLKSCSLCSNKILSTSWPLPNIVTFISFYSSLDPTILVELSK